MQQFVSVSIWVPYGWKSEAADLNLNTNLTLSPIYFSPSFGVSYWMTDRPRPLEFNDPGRNDF